MINCDGLVKIYETDDKKVMALEGLDLTVETGEMLAFHLPAGQAGSGLHRVDGRHRRRTREDHRRSRRQQLGEHRPVRRVHR